MRRSRRLGYQRLDYRALHSAGTKVTLNSSELEQSDGESDHDECRGSPSQQGVDPLLLSQFEELSITCQSTSEVPSLHIDEAGSVSPSELFNQDTVIELSSPKIIKSHSHDV